MAITSSLMKAIKYTLKQLTTSFLLGIALFGSLQADRGEELFMLNCQACHGPDGKGQTDVGKALKAKDLTSEAFKNGTALDQVSNTILKGIPGTGKAGFPYLNKADRDALAKHVLSIHKGGALLAVSTPAPKKVALAKLAAAPKKVEATKPVVKFTSVLAAKEATTPAPEKVAPGKPAAVPKKVETPKSVFKSTPALANKEAATSALKKVAPATPAAAPKATAASGESETIKNGRKLYKSNGCTSCHGDDLLAGTPTGMMLKARNLVADPYKQGASVEGIMGTLKNGIPGSPMAAYPGISPENSRAIATFIMAVREGKAEAIDNSDVAPVGAANKVSISYAMSLVAEQMRMPIRKSFVSDSAGAKVYSENCASCHGENGQSNIAVKMISSAPYYRVRNQALLGHNGYWLTDKAAFVKLITEGLPGRLMPGNGTLTKIDINQLHDYLKECFIKK